MADEITVTVGLKADKGDVKVVAGDGIEQYTVDMTNQLMRRYILEVADTSEHALPITAIAAANIGFICIKNLSSAAAEYVDFGPTGALFVRVGAGEMQVFKVVPAVAPYYKGASGTPALEITLIEA